MAQPPNTTTSFAPPQGSQAVPPTLGMAKLSVEGAINPPGHWDFFLSHTLRDCSIERHIGPGCLLAAPRWLHWPTHGRCAPRALTLSTLPAMQARALVPSKCQALALHFPTVTLFFLSTRQRDPLAVMLAEMLCSELAKVGKTVWLDVHMSKRDMAAMEEGAKNCKCFLAIVTDNGQDSYFSRPMCRDEIKWAQVTPPIPYPSPKPRPEVWKP